MPVRASTSSSSRSGWPSTSCWLNARSIIQQRTKAAARGSSRPTEWPAARRVSLPAGGARVLADDGVAGRPERLDTRGRRADEAVEDRVPENRDLVVGGGRLDDRAQDGAVLAVEGGDVGERRVQVLARVAVAREPEVALSVELVDDVLGQTQQELALVAEVEVERGARDPRAGRDALDVEVGVGDALVEQRLGRLENGRLHRGTLRRRCAARLAPHRHAINVMDGAPVVLWHPSQCSAFRTV